MGETVWINGAFVDRSDARVSAFDAGFVHGVGLFETMIATRAGVRRMGAHLARLAASAKALGLTESLRTPALGEAVELVVERSGLATGDGAARVRLSVTGGDLNMLAGSGRGPSDPTVVIHASPRAEYPAPMFEKGVTLGIAEAKANPLNPFEGHKTLDYWWRLRALQDAASRGLGEALVLQVTNHVCGGAVSNLFAVRGGSLLTPLAHTEEGGGALHSPVLPGITRASVIADAEAMGVGTERRLVTIEDVLDADELFLTNSGWGVLPVVRVEGKEIGSGEPGELTNRLRGAWLAETWGA